MWWPYRLLMFTESRMDDAAIEEDLGGVGDTVEGTQCLFELLFVVVGEGGHPGLDFLRRI